MKTYSFYDAATGEFMRGDLTVPAWESDAHIVANTPPGHVAIEGRFGPDTHVYDVVAGRVLARTLQAPSDEHEWDDELQRWRPNAAALARRLARENARVRIVELEARQPRALREIALGDPDARRRLQAIEDEIAQLRPLVQAKP